MIYIERQKRLRTNSKQKSTSRLHGRKHNDKLDSELCAIKKNRLFNRLIDGF